MVTYVAAKNISAVEDGRVVRYKAGDEIPGFESWSNTAKHANLNLGFVVRKGGEAEPPKEFKGYKQAHAPVKAKPVAPDEDIACGECSRTFKNQKALKAHKARAHKEE